MLPHLNPSDLRSIVLLWSGGFCIIETLNLTLLSETLHTMNLKSFALFAFLVSFTVTLLMGLLNLALELQMTFFKQVILTTVVNVLVLLSPVVYEKLVGAKKVVH